MTDTHVLLQQQTATAVVQVLRTHVAVVQDKCTDMAVAADSGLALAIQPSGTALVRGMEPGALVVAPVVQTAVVAMGIQGPPGPDIQGALREDNLLAEFAQNVQAQQQVQKNIGLGVEDPLAYYILAKS